MNSSMILLFFLCLIVACSVSNPLNEKNEHQSDDLGIRQNSHQSDSLNTLHNDDFSNPSKVEEKDSDEIEEKNLDENDFNVGLLYYTGEEVPQDYGKAFEWFIKSAEQGHIQAQFNVGDMYLKGTGVLQNNQEAFRWFLTAAEQGHVQARFNVGVLYATGIGVAQNNEEAFEGFTEFGAGRTSWSST